MDVMYGQALLLPVVNLEFASFSSLHWCNRVSVMFDENLKIQLFTVYTVKIKIK